MKNRKLISILLIVAMMFSIMPTAIWAEVETVSIDSVSVESTNLDGLKSYFKDFAEVSEDDGIITIKLTKNITGRIYFDVEAHFIFDANGKTISGQGQNEALCLDDYGYTTVELIGGGVFTTGRNQTIYVGSGNTLIVKDAVIVGEIDNYGTVKTAPQSGNLYYNIKINDGTPILCTEEQTLSDYIGANDTLVVQPLVVEDGDEAIWAGGTNDDGIACGTLSEAIAASASKVMLYKNAVLSDNVTLGTLTVDLNGKTLTIPEGRTVTVDAKKALTVINTTDSAGGLVVAGEVIANGNLNISSLAYGEGGLIKSQGGTLHIGATGNVTLVPDWVNGDPNNFVILGTTAEGAKLTLGSKYYMYEDNAWEELGSEANPVPITSLADLEALAENVNSGTAGNNAEFYYQLVANIDLSDKYGEGKDSWMPIGTDENPFTANLDGNGKSITGLYCVDDDLKYAGLFGAMNGSEVKNLTLSGKVISNADEYECYAGLLAGSGEGVNVTNCTFSGIVQAYYYQGRGSSSIVENYGEIFGTESVCTYGTVGEDGKVTGIPDISKVAACPVGHSVTDGNHIAYEIGKWEDVTYVYVRVLGKYPESGGRESYQGKYLATTFGHHGFELKTLTDSDESFNDKVDVAVSSVNGGRYAKISYTVNNVGGTEDIVGKLGMHADTQIGTNDNATVSVIKNDTGKKVIGLSLTDPGSASDSDDAQFSLYFADVAGIDPELEADTFWFGSYTGAESNCFTQLANVDNPYSGDSGMAVSWEVNVPAGKSVTYSVIVGAGAAAKPIKWAVSDPVSDPLTWDLVGNELTVTANVVDESEGAKDTLFYTLDGEECDEDDTVTVPANKDGVTQIQIDEENAIELSEGNHVLYFYVGNDLGGFTTQKAVPVAVPDSNGNTYNINGTITSSSNIELKLMQGDKVISQTITDEDGKYQFVNLSKGDYNLVITTAGGATTTVLVTVAGNDVQAGTITPPAAESIVDNTNAGDFAATVGGLDSIAAAGSGDITLTVTAEEEDEHDTNQAAIVSIADEQELAFIDITLTSSDGYEEIDIGGTNNQLLSIVIPFNGEGKQDIQVYSYHDGAEAANKMKKNPNIAEGEEGFKYENGFVTIHAKRFSTYAIGYTEVSDTPVYNGGYYVPVAQPKDEPKEPSKLEAVTACHGDASCPMGDYVDIDTNAWYHDGVHYCLSEGILSGYGNGIFHPDADTSRAMIAAMLWRLEGNPVVNYALDYKDVQSGEWYTEAIRWMVSEGLAAGYGNGSYGPNDAITREQLAAILRNYAIYKGYDVSVGESTNILSYGDAFDVSDWAYTSLQWACGSGVVGGMRDTAGQLILAPAAEASRAQVATMMMRFCEDFAK